MLSTMVSRNLSPVSIHTDVKLSLTRQPRDQGVGRGEGEERRAEQVRNLAPRGYTRPALEYLVPSYTYNTILFTHESLLLIQNRQSLLRLGGTSLVSPPPVSITYRVRFPLLYSPSAALCTVRR